MNKLPISEEKFTNLLLYFCIYKNYICTSENLTENPNSFGFSVKLTEL